MTSVSGPETHPGEPPRRPLKTRETRWANRMAAHLIARQISPNLISLMSILFAAVAGFLLCVSPRVSPGWRSVLFIAAGLGIQLRLLCNMLDGMVAVGSGKQSRIGEILNDLPDRISDCLILVGAGYAVRECNWGVETGWVAAILAVMTAYVRLLGGSLGLPQSFKGPMAKPHRMAVLTAALLIAAAVTDARLYLYVLLVALLIICAGCIATLWRRLGDIVQALRERDS